MLIITILLLIITVTLLGILMTCIASYRDAQTHFKWIYNEFFDCKQSLQSMADNASEIAKNIESICSDVADIQFKFKNLEKHEINKAIKIFESIEASLAEIDLKYIHDSLSSLESSLEIITDHPAFTKHDDDLF